MRWVWVVSPDYKSETFAGLVLGPGSSPAAIFRGNKVIFIFCKGKYFNDQNDKLLKGRF